MSAVTSSTSSTSFVASEPTKILNSDYLIHGTSAIIFLRPIQRPDGKTAFPFTYLESVKDLTSHGIKEAFKNCLLGSVTVADSKIQNIQVSPNFQQFCAIHKVAEIRFSNNIETFAFETPPRVTPFATVKGYTNLARNVIQEFVDRKLIDC